MKNFIKFKGFIISVWQLIYPTLLALIVCMIIIKYIMALAIVDGHSMYPTLINNQKMFAYKLGYNTYDKPDRFDIVIINTKRKLSEDYIIKRVIGLPGETVRIDNKGNIFINDEKLDENYGREVIEEAGIAINGIVLGDNEYFVLGDNRNDSLDSRNTKVGKVNKADIIAEAIDIPLLNMWLKDDFEDK